MSLMSYRCRELIEQWGALSGIDRMGFASAEPVNSTQQAHYAAWLASGANAGMDYLTRYPAIRNDPRELLPGARTVISCAVSYWHQEKQSDDSPRIAMYAHGDDYHEVMRRVLGYVAGRMTAEWGVATRVCVDTAPVHERYWALRSGVGFRGRNGLLIVPGVGSYCFLGEIITTMELEPTRESVDMAVCEGCGRCVKACPGGALNGDGTMDCSKCFSYLTIEHRGDFPDGFHTGGRLAGCDTCQQVCPHNLSPRPTGHPEFLLRQSFRDIKRAQLETLTPESYAELFRHSPLRRLKLSGILRNLHHL